MNVVDSSGWLEYFADGLNADFVAPAIENIHELMVRFMQTDALLSFGPTDQPFI